MSHNSEQVDGVTDTNNTNLDTFSSDIATSNTESSASDQENTFRGDLIVSLPTPYTHSEQDSAVVMGGDKPDEAFTEVRLTLLLVSGKRHTFKCKPTDIVGTVKKRVFDNWPKEWADETPAAVSNLKIVHLGRFLEDGSTLECKLESY
ncbi:hypothetical protein G9A89_015604 [Geosiphon pyriformis]|nr:hypothetical protein G9A89_015604 [Geosiphon pyriformis]